MASRSAPPDLSVIVVTHDGRELALEALRTARAAAGPVAVEWLVVDSGSSDGVPDAIERAWGDVPVLRRGNVGFAAANNVALERARGRYVLLMNPDVEVLRGTLADLVAALDRRPGVGAAGVAQVSPEGSPLPSARRFPSPAREIAEALLLSRLPGARRLGLSHAVEADGAAERSVDWTVGAFLAVRREALERVGGLDERYFLYSEEVDWCRRIRDAGWDVRHLPVMTVLHRCGGYDRPRLRAQLTHSKALFAREHMAPARRAAYLTALAVRHLARLAALGPLVAVRPGARDRARGEAAALALLLGAGRPPFEAVGRSANGKGRRSAA